MATSAVDIANRALRKVKQKPVETLTESSPSGLAAQSVYDESRRYLLRRAPWTFAIGRKQLARLTETPPFEYDYYYALPADNLRIIDLYLDSAAQSRMRDFRKERPGIACSLEAVYCRYVMDIEDPNLMTSDFRAALEDHMAYRFALDLPGSRSQAEFHLNNFERITLPRATANDAIEDGDYEFPETEWTTARWRNGGGSGWGW